MAQDSLDDALFEEDDRQARLHRSVSFLSAQSTASHASVASISGILASEDGADCEGPAGPGPDCSHPASAPDPALTWLPSSPSSSGLPPSPPTSPVSPLLTDSAWRDAGCNTSETEGGSSRNTSARAGGLHIPLSGVGVPEGSKAKLSTSQLLRTLHVSEFHGGSPVNLAVELARGVREPVRMSRALPPPSGAHAISGQPVTWAAYLDAGEASEDERVLSTPPVSLDIGMRCSLASSLQVVIGSHEGRWVEKNGCSNIICIFSSS